MRDDLRAFVIAKMSKIEIWGAETMGAI